MPDQVFGSCIIAHIIIIFHQTMELMSNDNRGLKNLLPHDGEAFYIQDFLDKTVSENLFKTLCKDILWEQDEFLMYGKKILTRRKVAWYGSKPYEYTYSKITRKAHIWHKDLKYLSDILQEETGNSFNSCLLNLYPEGRDGMGWHSDDEKELRPLAAIASLSLGSDRKFSFKHRLTKETVSLTLQNGSLLLMKGSTQKHWLHQLPKTKKIIGPRINLTFRSIIDSNAPL
ncbi:alpha-ketoglutarate-dependent dioxygenase AlkB family protein [Lutimonas sp.]|uniref:alpha-ketoglutarate-dependent dioxygenase AlkB family protein n=1 Tax=Lutimonas sp. TaxID=1872403 RepID=UPI003C720740